MVTGTDSARRALRQDQIVLVLLARDAAGGQIAKVQGILRHREIPVRWISSRDILGRALGEAHLSVVGVTQVSFAEQLLRRLPSDSRKGPPQGDQRETKEEPKRDAGR